MNRRIWAIATNTLREALRQRVLYLVGAFMLFLLLAAELLAPLALGEGVRLVRDIGLSAVSLLGMLLLVMVGTTLLQKELERRSIYVLLSKPVSRSEYLLGKYLGLVLMVSVCVLGMTLSVFGVDFLLLHKAHPEILWCGLGTLAELCVLTSWTMVFSVAASPFLAGIFTMAIYLIGNAAMDLRDLAELLPVGGAVLRWGSYLLPNLFVFNFRPEVAQGVIPGASQVGFALLYGGLHTTLVLMAASAVFRRKEFA